MAQENLVRTIELEQAGLEVVLHERWCVNCGRKYKVLTTSTQMTCQKQCQIDAELDPAKRRLAVKQIATMKQKAPPDPRYHKPKQQAPAPPKELTRLEEMEIKWKRYVGEARQHVTSLNANRIHVAKLALEVCDIRLGGGAHWSEFEDVFTLKKFAIEIGVSYKTLHGWCRVLQNVIQKLPAGEYDDKNDYYAAVTVANKSKRTDSPEKIQREFKKAKARGTQEHYLLQVHRRMKSGAYFIHHRANLAKLDPEILKELQNNCQAVVNDINKFFRGDK